MWWCGSRRSPIETRQRWFVHCGSFRYSMDSGARLGAICTRSRMCCCASSAMVEAHPEIVELDCNPLLAGPDGAVVLDARVRVEAAPPLPLPSVGR